MIARVRYGRAAGKVECAGKDAGEHQVSAGMAWVYPRYAPKDSPLYGVQGEAKAAKFGLWADNEPVPPWEWRKAKAPVAYFSPFNQETDNRNCRTCAYSIGYGEHHVFCQRVERVTVFPCGRWERGVGCDEPERAVAESSSRIASIT